MPNELKTLKVLSEALLLYAKGLDVVALPKLTFSFDHSPTDLPGVSSAWAFTVKLVGLKEINQDNGSKINSYERTWEGTGDSPEEAFGEVFKQVQEGLVSESRSKREQLASLNDAVRSLEASSVDLEDLWPKRDPAPSASAAHAQT